MKVNCYHSGQFKTEKGGLYYVDGVVDVVEVNSITIFGDVVLKMLEKRIDIGKMWYKLPFEDVEDKKPLWENVDVNKQKMESAGRWMKELDIYFEKSVVVDKEADKEDDETYHPCDVNSDDGSKSSEAGLSDSDESNDEFQVVEENVEEFNTENYEEQILDEDEVYPQTDDSSGDEEEQAERMVRRDLLDGVFSLRQLFSTGNEFKKNVIRYILKTRRNIVFDRWEKTKLGARCKGKGCG